MSQNTHVKRMSTQTGSRLASTGSARNADLDLSRLSQLSNASSINLGGLDYPIGARIGSSGLFVIGNPAYNSKDNVSMRTTESRLSQVSSHSTLVDGGCPVINKGYDFEYWAWPAIRYSCLVVAFAICVALLGATIGLSVQQTFECHVDVHWWQGSVLYHVSVPTFQDFQKNDIGDLKGVNDKVTYFSYLGIGVVSLSGFMPTVNEMWKEPELTSFEEVDKRVGTLEDFDMLVKTLHENHMKVLLDWSPVFTSTQHTWFQKSRIQSSILDTGYTNLYLWSAQEDKALAARQNGSWKHDNVRNEFYLHRGNLARPLLNWDDPGLHDLWKKVMKFWLGRGVDGFIVRHLDDIYVTNRNTVRDILSDWRSVLDSSRDKYNHKILMLESSYLAIIKQDRPELYSAITASIDLIEQPLGLTKVDTVLQTSRLEADIKAGLAWGNVMGGPWTSWTVANLKSLGSSTVTALEMLSLMLPGTPSVIAGQEVGKFYTELVNPLDSDMRPMLWRTESVFPYIAGSALGDTNVKLLAAIIKARRSASSLQHDSDVEGKQGDTKQFNYEFLELEDDTILLRRRYQRQSVYYIGINFGKKLAKRNWSKFSVMAHVVADSLDVYSGNIDLQKIVIQPNQAVVLSVIN